MNAKDDTGPATPPRHSRASHLLALAAVALCWPLLISGGQVTTYKVGMAVPDWPTTFGMNMFLYDMWTADWGAFIEHRHRLMGSYLGMATIVLAGWFLWAEPRRWLKGLGVTALVLVLIQGLLGGIRVRMNSTAFAAVHGCSAQAVFAFLVAVWVCSGRRWAEAGAPRVDAGHFRRRAAVTLGLVYAQIVAGAVLRHYGTGLVMHAALAAAVWGHALALSVRVERRRAEVPELVPAARAMAVLVTLQVALGIAAWWVLSPFDGVARPMSVVQANIRTGHLANGSLLLAAAVVLTLRAYRSLVPAPAASPLTPAPRGLEVVA